MNLTKKIATLAIFGVIGASSLASAANIGIIDSNEIYSKYNGIGAIQMQMNKLDAEYEPKYNAEVAKIEKLPEASRDAAAEKSLRPLGEELNKKRSEILAPLDQKVTTAIDALVKEKAIDVVVFEPSSVAVVKKDDNVNKLVNLTDDIIARINK